jgi:hypothetical protein
MNHAPLPYLTLPCLALIVLCGGCSIPSDLCRPVDGRVGFFSRGDCVLTRESFFGGHEWITFLANESLPPERRLPEEAIGYVVEGNRRVDYPKEMLIHLNNGLLAYTSALQNYHNQVENQPEHFLLNDKNTAVEAAAAAVAHIKGRTLDGLSRWGASQPAALTRFGQATHTIQDSYSEAHTVRRALDDNPLGPTCLAKVKAYMPRAKGHDDPNIEFHGGDSDDDVGHTTSHDSIYRPGRGCNDPTTVDGVSGCLNAQAQLAREATAAYLGMVFTLALEGADEATAEAAVDAYAAEWLSLCEEMQ